jgi:hypothetical protein
MEAAAKATAAKTTAMEATTTETHTTKAASAIGVHGWGTSETSVGKGGVPGYSTSVHPRAVGGEAPVRVRKGPAGVSRGKISSGLRP